MLVSKTKLINFIEKFEFKERIENTSIIFDSTGMKATGHDTLRTLIFDIHDKSVSFEPMTLHLRNISEFRRLLDGFDEEIDIKVKNGKIHLSDSSLKIKIDELGEDARGEFTVSTVGNGFWINDNPPIEYTESFMVDGAAVSKALETLSPVKSHCYGLKISNGSLVISVNEATISGSISIKGIYDGNLNVSISDYIKLITKIHKTMIHLQYGTHPTIMFTIENDTITSKYIVVIKKVESND